MQKPLIPALLLVLLSFGCGKSNDDQTPDGLTTWSVTLFKQNDGPDYKDDTALFTGYSFEFNAGNEVIVHLPGGGTKPAKWEVNDQTKVFSIFMDPTFAPVDALLGDWVIESQTTTDIKLKTSQLATVNIQKELHFKKD